MSTKISHRRVTLMDDGGALRRRLEHGRPSRQDSLTIGCMCPRSMMRNRWCIDDYVIGKRLHTGAASLVFRATCKQSSMPVVIKLYNRNKLHPVNHAQVKREVDLHSRLSHPNIVTLYGAFESDSHYFIVQEFADGGDLFDEMRSRRGLMTEKEVVGAIVVPLLDALVYCHSQGIIHRDIKPENVLFTEDMTLKLADFGLAINQNDERPVTRAGTLEYMPPEVLVNPGKRTPTCNKDRLDLVYDAKVDVWALAVVVYELLYGFPTFGKKCREATTERILSGDLQFHPDVRDVSADAVDFLQTCLSKKPAQRCSAREVLRHSWIQSFCPRNIPGRHSMSSARPHVAQIPAVSTRPARASCHLPRKPLATQGTDLSTNRGALLSGDGTKAENPTADSVSAGSLLYFSRRKTVPSRMSAGREALERMVGKGLCHAVGSCDIGQPITKPLPGVDVPTVATPPSVAVPVMNCPPATLQGSDQSPRSRLTSIHTSIGSLPWQHPASSGTADVGPSEGKSASHRLVSRDQQHIQPGRPMGTVAELKDAIAEAKRRRRSLDATRGQSQAAPKDPEPLPALVPSRQSEVFDAASVRCSLREPSSSLLSPRPPDTRVLEAVKMPGRLHRSLDLPPLPSLLSPSGPPRKDREGRRG